MENEPNSIASLLETTGDYLEIRAELLKLKAVDKSSEIVSSIASGLIITIIVVFGFIIINIGLCIWLGALMGQLWYGFFVVGGFYLLFAILILSFRSKWIKQPVSDMIIKKLLN